MIDAGRANIGIMRDDKGDFLAYALRPIKKGEEVRLYPQHGCCNEGSSSISFNHLSRLLECWTMPRWSHRHPTKTHCRKEYNHHPTFREVRGVCGVQLVHAYNKIAERNDASLFHYGFVQDLDPPLLAALDTPSGNLYDPTTYTEADFGEAV